MKHVFQLVENATGCRTQPMTATRQEFSDALKKWEGPDSEYSVLVIFEPDEKGEPYEFSKAPIMSMATFIRLHSPEDFSHVEG